MHILVTLMRQRRAYMVEECNKPSPIWLKPSDVYLSYHFGSVEAMHILRHGHPELSQDDIIEMESLRNECEFLRYNYRRG